MIPPPDVLVIEDEPALRLMYGRFLRQHGWRVDEAADGEAGLALARLRPPRLVLLDIGLPRLSGFEVARALRDDPRTSRVALVSISGYGTDEEYRWLARAAGCAHALRKPCRLDELLTVVKVFLASDGAADSAAAAADAPRSPAAPRWTGAFPSDT